MYRLTATRGNRRVTFSKRYKTKAKAKSVVRFVGQMHNDLPRSARPKSTYKNFRVIKV